MGIISYHIEIQVVEGDGCDVHQVGDTFAYPEDMGRLCPWLLDSVNSMVRVLQFGGTLPWTYKGTAYEKEIDPEGTAIEFVRCPDPTDAGVVVRIRRTRLPEPETVGWC